MCYKRTISPPNKGFLDNCLNKLLIVISAIRFVEISFKTLGLDVINEEELEKSPYISWVSHFCSTKTSKKSGNPRYHRTLKIQNHGLLCIFLYYRIHYRKHGRTLLPRSEERRVGKECRSRW